MLGSVNVKEEKENQTNQRKEEGYKQGGGGMIENLDQVVREDFSDEV